jgi:xylulokinase
MGKTIGVDGPLVIAIDSSTQSTKAIVVDTAGEVLAEAKHPIPLLTPQMDFYEHDPNLWWQTTKDSITDAVAKLTQGERDRIKAIGITHQRESFAPFREDGTPLANGILWLDGRAVDQIAHYGSAHVHELSGKPAGVTPGIYKMAWVKEHRRELFAEADRVAEVHAAITFHLVGEWVTSQAAADSLGLFDVQKRDWSDELLEIAGVRREQMPRLVAPAHSMGRLLPELASEWKIAEVEVIAGLGDGQAAGIGAAAVEPGIGYLNMGTAVNAGIESPHYVYDPAFRTHVSGIPGSYVLEVLQSSGSYLADWVRNTFADPDNPGSCDVVRDTERAAKIAPGCDGLITLPYWNAVQSPYWDAKARGVVAGWRGTHTRAHFYRSTLESIGFEMRRNLDYLEKAGGERIRELRIMGGGTRSVLWRQIMADIVGVPLVVCAVDEVSAFGAAVVAMAGIGAHGDALPDGTPDVAASAKAMAHFGETIEPHQEQKARYAEIGAIQAKIYPQMKEIFEELDAVVRKHEVACTREAEEKEG